MVSNSKFLTRFVLCFIVLFGALGINKAMASHYAAVDVWVDSIGTDSTNMKYRVFMQIYKACEGQPQADLSTQEGLTVSSVNAGTTISRTVQIVNLHQSTFHWPTPIDANSSHGPFDTLDKLCGGVSPFNLCRQPFNPNIQNYPAFVRGTYIDTVTVPTRATDWKFVWTSGARNASIINLNPNQGSIWCEVLLNNMEPGRWNNSSPRYTQDPLPFICVNQPNQFVNGPIEVPLDNSLDSMITINNYPQNNGGVNFGYTAGYNLANPLGSVTPYTVNPINGTATFTPGTTGNFVIAFRTYEYARYGQPNQPHVLMGYISRDVQVAILPCSSAPPSIDSMGINIIGGTTLPGNSSVILACPGVPLSFDVQAISNNPVAYLLMIANNAQSAIGSLFTTVITPGQVTGSFKWTPSVNDIGDHVLVITAKDSTCNNNQPLVLVNSVILTIRVAPGLDGGADGLVCPLGDRPYQMHVSGPPNVVYEWVSLDGSPAPYLSCTQCRDPLASPPVDYTYVVKSDDPILFCKNRDTVNIFVDKTNYVTASPGKNPLIICRPRYETLTSQGNGPKPLQNLPCGTGNPQTCNIPDSVTIGKGTTAANIPANTPFYSVTNYSKYQFIIPKGEMLSAGFYSGTIQSLAFLNISPTQLSPFPLTNVVISLTCTDRTTFPVSANNNDFEPTLTQVATVGSYTITPNAWNQITFSNPYSWDTAKNLLVDICIGNTTPNATGTDPVAMTPGYAIQRFSSANSVCNGIGSVSSYPQRPVVKLYYCPPPELDYTYWWVPGDYMEDSMVQNPYMYIPRSKKYTVYARGRNGCLLKDVVDIIVPIHTLTLNPPDSFICVGQNVQLHATGAAKYKWYQTNDLNGNDYNPATSLDCDDCPDPMASPKTSTKYFLVFTDAVDCSDTMSVTIIVNPLPNVVIRNNDTTIKFGQHVNLYAVGAYQYTWTPVGSLNDPNIPNPVASPTESTTYVVYGMDRNQCQDTDTVHVKVDFRDNLMVPSGFTPNGDGKNDFFKVVNLTFQQIMEFRVFNRWGQEIFSTTDNSKGWDGSWKGVPQDMGDYHYLIRVGFPDGYVETYKGDVALIR